MSVRRDNKQRSVRQCCPFVYWRTKLQNVSCLRCAYNECKQMSEVGLDYQGNDLPWIERPICAARTRAGTPCLNRVVGGKRRCRLHGGLSTGARTKEGIERIRAAQRKRWAKVKSDTAPMDAPIEIQSEPQKPRQDVKRNRQFRPTRNRTKRWRF